MAVSEEEEKMIKKLSVFVYWAIIVILLGLFFTNDFGLVDIRKSSIIVAVGIDKENDEVQVTAQLAVPQPSENGDSVQYTQVQGSGYTIADALNEINAKTGFYPQLLFCKLVLIGEECKEEELFKLLSCFYRRNFSELTALVAMCQGKASDMLALSSSINSETTESIKQVLSDELKKSANVSSVNLKEIAQSNFSVSKACYMPYIEANKPGTSAPGGGDSVGGEQGGSSGGSASGQQSGEEMEFTARKTAYFSEGKFKGFLNSEQSFALDVINNDIRLAVLPFVSDGEHYTLGLKNTKGAIKLKVKDGVPELTFTFKAKAQIQGVKKSVTPENSSNDDVVPPQVLKSAEEEMQKRFADLLKVSAESNCDILKVRELLHKYNHKYYDAFREDILSRVKVNYKIDIRSVN